MSDSAMPRGEYLKIAPASKNMHMTGKEKTLVAKPAHDVPAVGGTVFNGEYGVTGTDVLSDLISV
ncbi:MAG: hypothetical protein ABSC64_19005 [Candidatus Korobacteraceae bacterium]